MFDLYETYSFGTESLIDYPITKPNIKTGEGRMKIRGRDKIGDKKKKTHRKMTKKSRRANRR